MSDIPSDPRRRRRAGRSPSARLLATILLAGTATCAGCGHIHEARRLYAAGDPAAAVPLYQEAVRDSGFDPGYMEELTAARRAAAAEEIRRAETALQEDREDEALDHAMRAASFDADARAFESSLRHELARGHLERSERRLAQGDYATARDEATAAAAIAHDLAEADDLLARIDAAEAASLRQAIYAALERGDEAAAVTALERLLALEPDEAAERILEQLRGGR